MRKLLLFVLLLAPCSLRGQDVSQTVLLFNGTPTGACPARKLAVDYLNSLLYFCSNSAWFPSTAGGGSGSVTSVGLVGTANQITVTGSTPITTSGSWTLNTGNAVGPNQNLIYVLNSQFASCGSQTNCYTANGDDSTSNNTVLANVATAADAFTRLTVNTQLVSSPTVIFAPGTYKYSVAPAFTNPVTISCPETGVFFDYSGSAHAWDFGSAGLVLATDQSGIYTINGCGFTGGATMTQGIFFNQFLVNTRVLHNSFRNFGPNASATAFMVYFAGNNWGNEVAFNQVLNDDNVARNFTRIDSQGGQNSQLRFHDNDMVEHPSAHPTQCATASGIALWVDGTGSNVYNNNFGCGYVPAIRVGSQCQQCFIGTNYYEQMLSGSTVPVIQYGDPTGGYNASTAVDGLHINGGYANMHSNATPFLGPTATTSSLVNSYVAHLRLANFPATQPVVSLNNVSGQIGNIAEDIYTGTATTYTPNLFLHTVPGGLNILNWTYLGQGSYADGFTRANETLTTPWITIPDFVAGVRIVSNLAECSTTSCGSLLVRDMSNNQRVGITVNTVPTGVNQVAVYDRTTVSTVTGHITGYVCTYVNGTGTQLYKAVNGAYTQLGSTSAVTVSAGAQLEVESIGTVHSCYLNGALIIQANDTAVTTGFAAIQINGTTGKVGPFTAKGLP